MHFPSLRDARARARSRVVNRGHRQLPDIPRRAFIGNARYNAERFTGVSILLARRINGQIFGGAKRFCCIPRAFPHRLPSSALSLPVPPLSFLLLSQAATRQTWSKFPDREEAVENIRMCALYRRYRHDIRQRARDCYVAKFPVVKPIARYVESRIIRIIISARAFRPNDCGLFR